MTFAKMELCTRRRRSCVVLVVGWAMVRGQAALEIAGGLDRVSADVDMHKATVFRPAQAAYSRTRSAAGRTSSLSGTYPLARPCPQAKIHQEADGRAGDEDIIRLRPGFEPDLVRLAHHCRIGWLRVSRTVDARTGRMSVGIMCFSLPT